MTAPAADTVSGVFKSHAWWLAPVGRVLLNDQWSLFGKAGLTRVTTDFSAISVTGATAPSSASQSNAGWLIGAGATYDINRGMFVKMEWDRFGRVGVASATTRGDIDQIGVGFGLRFQGLPLPLPRLAGNPAILPDPPTWVFYFKTAGRESVLPGLVQCFFERETASRIWHTVPP